MPVQKTDLLPKQVKNPDKISTLPWQVCNISKEISVSLSKEIIEAVVSDDSLPAIIIDRFDLSDIIIIIIPYCSFKPPLALDWLRKSGSFRDESSQTDMQIINVSPIQNGKHLRHLQKKKKKLNLLCTDLTFMRNLLLSRLIKKVN